MNKNLQAPVLLILLIFCLWNATFSQQVLIDNSHSVQQLVENHLASGCVEISNVSSSINGTLDGLSSFGSFQKGSSSFPLENGIVISTGNAASGGNTINSNELSEGTSMWGSDPDIEDFLGAGSMINATVIEFDFVALSDMVQFNYLLASEEYFANFPCNAYDGFVFLIRPTNSTGPYQNIALVPSGTNSQITVRNIHDEIPTQCAATNDAYFDGYGIGDTNFNGRTTVLTAGANVNPNEQYHVKLVVAESLDSGQPQADTAVFIEANSFTELELGDDISTCSSTVNLNGKIQNPLATYAWFRNNVLITGETNPTLAVTTSGLYRVEISIDSSSCTIKDDVNITIDSEINTDPIDPYQLCDTDGNGQEFFDLSSKDSDIENAIQNLPTTYTIRYYLTDDDSRNNPNNNITSLTSASRTIYVRVEDTTNGCLIYGNFNLVVNSLPISIQPLDLDVCDNDNVPNNRTNIDLSQKDDEITGGDPDSFVTYHYTQGDANSGSNPISNSYTNTDPIETLYIRVTNNITGCVTVAGHTLTINVTNGNANIIRDLQYIDACDPDHDGSATFDLSQVVDNILNGENGFLPPTFHISYEDAENAINAISNPENYVNSEQNEETVYVRLVNASTGCYAIIPIELHTNLLLTGTNIPETGFAFCDQDYDGVVAVDLDIIENVIQNGLTDVSISFYETENDRINNINALNTNVPYEISAPITLYLNLSNGNCNEISEVILRINPLVTFSQVEPIPYCDNDDDGVTTVDFEAFDSIITGGNNGFSVRYFISEMDAENGINQLPRYYDTSSENYFARIENNNTGCYTVNPFEIEVIPAPTVTQPNDIIICNSGASTTANIRLADKISEIVTDPSGLIIEFFNNFNDAQNFDASNPINNLDKESYNSETQTIFVRIQSTNLTACYTILNFNLIVNTIPIISNISPYQICVDEGTTAANFYFQTRDAEILNGQTGKEVYYFQDASLSVPLDKNIAYNSAGAETIYVRVENITDPNCFSTSSFILEIGNNPNYNRNFTDFPPNCQNENLTRNFDFESKRNEIALGSSDNLDIQFYLDEADAINKSGNTLPNSFDSQALQGQFYARIENISNGCFLIEEVRFITFAKPVLTIASIDPVCDTDYDGNVVFDLTTATFQVDNVRFGDITYNYYSDELLTNQIPSSQLSNYPVSGSQKIYVEAKTDTGCTDSLAMELTVNLPPNLFAVVPIQECANDDNSFDLSIVDSQLIHSSTDASISYYMSQEDAENNVNPYVDNIYNYSLPGTYSIYARVYDNKTGCPAIASFEIVINDRPIVNTPPNLVKCDDDIDGMAEFDLSQNEGAILGSQSTSEYTVYYYSNITDANNDNNRLDHLFVAFNGETIYARVQHNATECYNITEFQTIVNPLPVIPLNDVEVLCLNDLPKTLVANTGNLGDTYLWWTGETTPEIQVNESDLGTDRWVEVTSAAPASCPNTKIFDLKQSEEAEIVAKASANFTDPNTITVTVSGIGDYRFSLDGDEPQESNVFENVTLGPHIVTVVDLNGCTPVPVEIFVIDIPKFVTPNNDNYFDTWHIVGIDRLPGTIVYIYNRQGKLLKTLPHTSIGWDGTYNGVNMPSDDYWFSADIIHNGESFNIKGHFSLKR